LTSADVRNKILNRKVRKGFRKERKGHRPQFGSKFASCYKIG